MVALILLLLPLSLFSKDFGVCGNTLPVREENLKEVLAKRASKLPESIEQILKNKAKHPHPISLKEATKKRRFTYVPKCVAPQTIKDLDGGVIVKKGQTVNPLDTLVPTEGLLFFDGTNPAHLSWAKAQEGEFDWILTKGTPLSLEEREDRPVYFDQGGRLSYEFGIEAIPAKVTPTQGKLIIEEIPQKKGGFLCN